ncbi:3396_t:CDS:1, partial [Acaulospora morrowiae]
EFGNKHVSLLISRLTPFSTSEEASKYGLDIVVQDDDQTLVSDASLASGVTKLQPLSLWDQLSKSVVVEGNNDVNSIHVKRTSKRKWPGSLNWRTMSFTISKSARISLVSRNLQVPKL